MSWTPDKYLYYIRHKDLTQSFDKSLYTHMKLEQAKWQRKNAIKTFHYTNDYGPT